MWHVLYQHGESLLLLPTGKKKKKAGQNLKKDSLGIGGLVSASMFNNEKCMVSWCLYRDGSELLGVVFLMTGLPIICQVEGWPGLFKGHLEFHGGMLL